MSSIFSKIIAGEIPAHKIAENDKFLAFLDVFPLVQGHVLVVPKKETDYIFDIEDAELSEMIIFAKQVSKAIRKAVPCKRIGMSVIGLEVPHAHIHLVPMNTANDLNFTREKIKPSQQELSEMAEKIKSNL
ncbi:MAG: putative HIT-like protein [Bacteroidetes bacterium]|nr:putative HIT-like protein [Bacteroidota bacterium]